MSTAAPSIPADAVVLHEILRRRRSARAFAPIALTDAELHELLWAGQGVTNAEGRRTAPSAGAMYPLEAYAVTAGGVFHFEPTTDRVVLLAEDDRRAALQAAAADQASVGSGAGTIVLAGVLSRIEARFGDRAAGYLLLDTAHAAENILIEASALGLAALPMASFDAAAVAAVLELPEGEVPKELVVVGHPLG